MEILHLLIELERFMSKEGINYNDSIEKLVERLNEIAMEEIK